MAQSQAFYTPDFELISEKITPIFLRDADVEINTLRGDFNTGDTESQDIDFILMAKKGQFYFEPLIGYDAQRLQNGRVDIVQETDYKYAIAAVTHSPRAIAIPATRILPLHTRQIFDYFSA